ncbi:uncharacterized protein LAESUDRAFT_676836 [Laetiporus sulphureus 93-53]|uniref:Origin recognition complex subunit 5 n=1 Tax=Laetiporus sulphureus 93-53 TaxID=1314785 RepID=A0A165F1L9_9APHY|nr:uncharacterized protein LAESUDRAFT_676836 [Laetiporus sulphureus 93-53]KZT08181.1 hypothetical protein LAESUDRAFT_676836 [Laetiporus sulphureus 93-53]
MSHVMTLLSTFPPNFIYLYDAENPRLVSSGLRSVLEQSSGSHLSYAFVDAISCFTQRLMYDTALNQLARWQPTWEDGCENWPGSSTEGRRWNESFDTFVHGLKSVAAQITVEAMDPAAKTCRLVLVVERAERLRETLPDLVVPLTRLAEMSQLDIITIFISDTRWEDIRPPLGASPEPYYIDAPTTSQKGGPTTYLKVDLTATLEMLTSMYPPPDAERDPSIDPRTYHPSLRPLYERFLSTLYGSCGTFISDPYELAYIAAATWPGFVQPLIDDHTRRLEIYHAQKGEEVVSDSEYSDVNSDAMPELAPASPADVCHDLATPYKLVFRAAMDALYPRITNATDWVRHSAPSEYDARSMKTLPRLAKFILVAAFLASTNPPKSDMRMFGRGPDERLKRRRRKGGSPRKPKAGVASIPQRLLGPTSFTLDRLLAILGVLLEENDADVRPPAPQYTFPGEYTDMEISRVAIYAQIMELASMHLLVRTSPPEKLDTPPSFKCGISLEIALLLARDVGVLLNDLMWEPM